VAAKETVAAVMARAMETSMVTAAGGGGADSDTTMAVTAMATGGSGRFWRLTWRSDTPANLNTNSTLRRGGCLNLA